MSVTSGFYNSLNNDRRYNAEQMSAIFDGVINDGVFSNIGTAFSVKASTGNVINIGNGRAWFNSKWLFNDSILPIEMEDSDLLLDRIDAIIIEINSDSSVRDGSIKYVKGTPSSSPSRPTLTNSDSIHQYPLAYIRRIAGSENITQANITNTVGTSECPYVTGILQVQNIDNIVAQWEAQWVEWYTEQTTDGNEEWQKWMQDMQNDFLEWYDNLQLYLEPEVATSLANAIAKLQNDFTTHIENYENPHKVTASQLIDGTLAKGIVASNDVDYEASRLRNIKASTSDLEAGVSALENGAIYLVYE